MKNILITGASGFVGSFLVEKALEENYRVFACVRFSSNLKYLSDKAIHLVHADITDLDLLISEFNIIKLKFGAFAVIHNAGLTEAIHIKEYLNVNHQGTINILKALKITQTLSGKFIYMSSLAAQGPSLNHEQILNEQTPLKPISSYGKSKLNAEQYLQKQTGIDYCILRPTAVYGPRNRGFLDYFKLINKHIEIHIGRKDQMLSFIYVEDLAQLALHLLNKVIKNNTIIVSDGANYTSGAFAAIIKKQLRRKTINLIVPKKIVSFLCHFNSILSRISEKPSIINQDKYHELTAPNWSCDPSRMINEIGFKPQTNLEEGIFKTIKWYKKNNLL